MTTSFKFNSEKATSGTFEPLPEGSYECYIESGAIKTSSAGNRYVDFKLKVRDDVDGQAYGGRILWGKLHFTEASEGVLHGFLKAIDTPEGKDFGEDHVTTIKDYAVGRAILAVVGFREWKGEIRNEVKYMNASKVGGGKVDSPFDTETASNPLAVQGIDIKDDDLPF